MPTKDIFDGDPELLAAYRRGDDAAYPKIMAHYRSRLTNYFRGKLAGSGNIFEDADSLVIETFVRAFRPKTREGYDPQRAPFGALLGTIAHTVYLDAKRAWIRKCLPWPSVSIDDFDLVSDERAPEEKLLEVERRVAREQYFDTLSPNVQKVWRLSYEEGLSRAVVAKRLELGEGEVRGIQVRIREGLKAFLRARCLLDSSPRRFLNPSHHAERT